MYNNDKLINNDNFLNDDWLDNFDNTDKLYQDFYKDDLYYVNLTMIYINRANEIERINQESFLMSKPNYISREEILEILKESSIDNEKRYSLLSILKYNITLDTEDVKSFIINSHDTDSKYLTIIKNIDAIPFEKTISMFQDLNELIIIFYEKSTELKQIDPNKVTKRIYFSNTKKRTIKKRYKD